MSVACHQNHKFRKNEKKLGMYKSDMPYIEFLKFSNVSCEKESNAVISLKSVLIVDVLKYFVTIGMVLLLIRIESMESIVQQWDFVSDISDILKPNVWQSIF